MRLPQLSLLDGKQLIAKLTKLSHVSVRVKQ